MQETELWDIYDVNRTKTGHIHCRGDPLALGEYHLAVFVWIRTAGGRYFITRRAPEKEVAPLIWEAVGGNALAGEDSLTAALREAREETGIALRPGNGMLFETIRREDMRFYANVWLFRQEVSLADFVPQPGETVEARLATPDELRAMVREGVTFFALEHIEPLFLFADMLDREHMLICPSPGTPHADIETLLADDFTETGAAGRTITREQGIATLVQRSLNPPDAQWRIVNYELRHLSETICLAAYTLAWDERLTRRSTIWRREGELWRATYHQGTNCLQSH